jgi:hypothetical protein
VGDPAGSNATADLALRVTGTHKPLHHDKVEIPSGGFELYKGKIQRSGFGEGNNEFLGLFKTGNLLPTLITSFQERHLSLLLGSLAVLLVN